MVSNKRKEANINIHQQIVKGLILAVSCLNLVGVFLLLNPQSFDTAAEIEMFE